MITQDDRIYVSRARHALLITPAITAALFLCHPCHADDSARNTQEPVIVSARMVPESPSNIAGTAGSITRNDIMTRHPAGIASLATLIPGVNKTSDSHWGADINIRGLSRNSVVMLIDGCIVNTANDLNARMGMVDPLEVERVEILKGPISALYGSGSIGGTVNVITRSGHFGPEEIKSGVAASYKSNPAGAGFSGFANYNSPDSYYYASYSYRDYDSYKDGSGTEVRNSQFQDQQTKLRSGWLIAENYSMELNGQYYEGREIGIPGSGTAPLPANADVTYPTVRRGLFNLVNNFDVDAEWLKRSSLDLYYQYVDRRVRVDNFPAAAPQLALYPRADHDTVGGKWINIMESKEHETTAGIDIMRRFLRHSERVRYMKSGAVITDQPLPNPTYSSYGAFVEDSWEKTDKLTIGSGLRFDAISVENIANSLWTERSENENNVNLHAGFAWRTTEQMTFKTIAAAGYRAASLEERYQYLELGGGTTKWGNPDLDPEKSTMIECSLNWKNENLRWTLSAFNNNLRDMISENSVDPVTIQNVNIDRAYIRGIEFETAFRIADVSTLYGNVTWLRGINTRTDEYLPDIAPVTGLLGMKFDRADGHGAWLSIETEFAGSQNDVPLDVLPSDSWTTVNAEAGYNLGNSDRPRSLMIRVDNIFDEDYRNYLSTVRGAPFNEPGRSVLIAINAQI